MQFLASASSHTRTQANKDRSNWTQTYRHRPTARSHWFMLTQRLTVESAPLPSPRRVATAGKGGEGKRCELDGWRGLQRLRPRVLLATSFDLIVAACMAASLTSTATWADFHGLLLSETPFCWFTSLTCHASLPLPLDCRLTHLAHHWQHAGSRLSWPRPHFDPALWHWDNVVWQFAYRGRGMLCVGWWGLTWLGWVVDFHPEFC